MGGRSVTLLDVPNCGGGEAGVSRRAVAKQDGYK